MVFSKSQIVAEYCKKYSDTPTLMLARIIYKNEPKLFDTIEVARSRIRYVRGQHGNYDRKMSAYKSLQDKSPRPYNPFTAIPDGIKDHDWKPFLIDAWNTLVLSDIHAPYHDKKAIEIAAEEGKKHKCDAILFNGDALDFYQLSRFDKDPRKRDIMSEVKTFVNIAHSLKSYLKCKLYFKSGNHEDRLENYIKVKAPELIDMHVLNLSFLLNSSFIKDTEGRVTAKPNGLDIVVTPRRGIIKINQLNVMHGHEFGKSVFSPVNVARGLYMRAKECAIQGHNHRTSHHTETTLNGETIATWSTGCLCDLHPDYMPINNWNLGFAIVEQDKNGFNVHNRKIINGKLYTS